MKFLQEENFLASFLSHFVDRFFKNLKRGTGLFSIVFLSGVFLAVDFWCAARMPFPFKFIMQVMILSVGYFYLCVTSHVFPVLAFFDEPVVKTIRHSFILAMRNGIYTVFVVILDLIPFFIFSCLRNFSGNTYSCF